MSSPWGRTEFLLAPVGKSGREGRGMGMGMGALENPARPKVAQCGSAGCLGQMFPLARCSPLSSNMRLRSTVWHSWPFKKTGYFLWPATLNPTCPPTYLQEQFKCSPPGNPLWFPQTVNCSFSIFPQLSVAAFFFYFPHHICIHFSF